MADSICDWPPANCSSCLQRWGRRRQLVGQKPYWNLRGPFKMNLTSLLPSHGVMSIPSCCPVPHTSRSSGTDSWGASRGSDPALSSNHLKLRHRTCGRAKLARCFEGRSLPSWSLHLYSHFPISSVCSISSAHDHFASGILSISPISFH